MLLNIQALRAMAALMVVFVHLKVLAARAGLAPGWLEFGNAGVDVFFVISGVIMVFTVERRETTAWNFLGHRIARIVPFYWLMTFAVFAVALFAPALVQSTRADGWDLFRSLAFIPYRKASGLMEPVVFVGWSLNYEMAFYLVFAATMLLKPRVLSFAACVAVIAGAAAFGLLAHPADPVVRFYAYAMTLEFAAGMAVGWAIPRLAVRRWMPPLAGVAAACAVVCLVAGAWVAPRVDRTLLAGIPAAILVASALVLERAGVKVGWPLVRKLGDASYAIYLTHFFVTQAVTRAAAWANASGAPEIAALFVLSFLLVAVVGLIVHARIEAPLSRMARDLMFRKRSSMPPEPVYVGEGAASP